MLKLPNILPSLFLSFWYIILSQITLRHNKILGIASLLVVILSDDLNNIFFILALNNYR